MGTFAIIAGLVIVGAIALFMSGLLNDWTH
jgi:hypothetical protein